MCYWYEVLEVLAVQQKVSKRHGTLNMSRWLPSTTLSTLLRLNTIVFLFKP